MTSDEIRVGVAFAENINLCFMDYLALRIKRRDLPEYRIERIRQLWGLLTDDQRSRFSNIILHPDHTGGGDLVMSWIGQPEDGSAAGQGQHVA